MPLIQERLASCFATVFPDLSDSQIKEATHMSVATWDSLATVVLISVIEEEFDVSLATGDLENMISFEQILGCLYSKTLK